MIPRRRSTRYYRGHTCVNAFLACVLGTLRFEQFGCVVIESFDLMRPGSYWICLSLICCI